MRKQKLRMHTYREPYVYATEVIVNKMRVAFRHPERLTSMRMGSAFAWEQMK
jgi:hypothetical protein